MGIFARLTPLALAFALTSLVASCAGGVIERGSRYGVRVGMTFEEANAILQRRGMRLTGETHALAGGCAARFRQQGEAVYYYSRRGDGLPPMSCLFTRDNRVVVIAWEAY